MKINLTKNDYRLLLDILSISSWVMTSHHTEKEERTAPYEALEQKLLSFANEFGFEKLVDYDKKRDEYSSSWEYEELATDMEFIDEYDEHNLWESLEDRLAQRDLVEELGMEAVQEMEPIERIKGQDKYVEKYATEFSKNGLMNLHLVLPAENGD